MNEIGPTPDDYLDLMQAVEVSSNDADLSEDVNEKQVRLPVAAPGPDQEVNTGAR